MGQLYGQEPASWDGCESAVQEGCVPAMVLALWIAGLNSETGSEMDSE